LPETLGLATLEATAEPDTDALGATTTSSPVPALTAEVVAGGSLVDDGAHTEVVIVVGSSLSVQVAVVAIWTQSCGAVKSDALGSLPACHDSGSYIDPIVLNICCEHGTGGEPE
jgi:hypothetical protein